MYKEIIRFIRIKFKSQDFIPLHIPVFKGNEKKYLNECIDSTYVSSVGPFVDKFEVLMSQITNTRNLQLGGTQITPTLFEFSMFLKNIN